MTIYPKSQYKFVGFELSSNPKKKYDAILINKSNGKQKKISFGAIKSNGVPYNQYFDNVLGYYSNYNHNDINRRKNYRSRMKHNGLQPYSANYFSYFYLW